MPDPRFTAKDTLTLIEARLAHEFNLIGHRMTWLVTSQSFLFAAWSVLINSERRPDSSNVHLLTYAIPTVGCFTAIAGWLAVGAALTVTNHLVTDRAEFDEALGLSPLSPLRADPSTRWKGQVPPALLPPLFVTAWVTALIRVGVPDDYIGRPQLLLSALVIYLCIAASWKIRLNRRFDGLRIAAQSKREKGRESLSKQATSEPGCVGPG